MNTTAKVQSMWEQKKGAVICSCGEDIIFYKCMTLQCPRYKTQTYYCRICNENGLHEHIKHENCINIINNFDKASGNLKEKLSKVEGEATKSYEKFKPLIQYFEKVAILMPLNNG